MKKIIYFTLTALIFSSACQTNTSQANSFNQVLISNQNTNFQPELDEIVLPYLKTNSCLGLSIGVINNNQSDIYNYGRTDCEGQTIQSDSVFAIASLSKTFTNLLLAQMVNEGLVSLNEPVEKYLPSEINVPEFQSRKITLLDLANHHSGLPRLPLDLFEKASDPLNPYADYSEQDVYNFLNNYRLVNEPGKTYTYSNLGTGLLGHALARRLNTSYEKLLQEKILEPLGLNNTTVNKPENQQTKLVNGFNNRDDVPYWYWQSLEGAGALFSTPADMLKFLSVNMGRESSALSQAAASSHRPVKRINDSLEIGLAWHVSNSKIIWHNGASYGFTSFMAFDKERQKGIFVLTNSGFNQKSLADEIGNSVLIKINQ